MTKRLRRYFFLLPSYYAFLRETPVRCLRLISKLVDLNGLSRRVQSPAASRQSTLFSGVAYLPTGSLLSQVLVPVTGLICVLLCYTFSAVAQTGALQTSITSVIHPAPNAASLGKFSDMPVSLYTGLPSVAVPLWEIKQGNAQVAISLSYHSGGVKVDDVSSWVGMGWALNAGGVITRSARGLPDIPPVYRDYISPRVHSFLQHTLSDSLSFLMNVYKGVEDSEPDVFNISVGGVSGRFFMGDDGNFIVAPRESNLRVAYDVTEASGQHYAWVITDGKGTQYKFNEAEYNTTTSIAYSDGKGSDGNYSGGDISSWYLTEVV